MSVRSDIKRAMRPARLEPWEEKGLFEAIYRGLRSGHVGPNADIVVPAITAGDRAYVLTLHLRGGIIDRFEVDHDPDRDGPHIRHWLAMKARNEAEAAESRS